MLSWPVIKLLPSHDLSVGDMFTDKPQNREKTTDKA